VRDLGSQNVAIALGERTIRACLLISLDIAILV
jgi:hypothetical protein